MSHSLALCIHLWQGEPWPAKSRACLAKGNCFIDAGKTGMVITDGLWVTGDLVCLSLDWIIVLQKSACGEWKLSHPCFSTWQRQPVRVFVFSFPLFHLQSVHKAALFFFFFFFFKNALFYLTQSNKAVDGTKGLGDGGGRGSTSLPPQRDKCCFLETNTLCAGTPGFLRERHSVGTKGIKHSLFSLTPYLPPRQANWWLTHPKSTCTV